MRPDPSEFRCPGVRAGLFAPAACAILALFTMLVQLPHAAEGAMITYISATRYIEGNGIPREDAVGFNDFDVSRGVTLGPNVLNVIARVEAAQTSRLLSDRIEVSCSTLTQFIQGSQGNSISANSFFDIVFSIDQPTQVTLSTGPIFSRSNGGGAGIALDRVDGSPADIFFATTPGAPQHAMLAAGTYRLSGGAASGSLNSVAGAAQTVATLTIPPVSAGLTAVAGLATASALRKRRSLR